MNLSTLNNFISHKGLVEKKQGVFYIDDPQKAQGLNIASFLKRYIDKCSLNSARVCLHASEESALHEMIIIMKKNAKVIPHRHLKKDEAFYMIEGEALLQLFNQGNVLKSECLLSSGDFVYNQSYYRIQRGLGHSLIPLSDYLIFKETTSGPFDERDFIRLDS